MTRALPTTIPNSQIHYEWSRKWDRWRMSILASIA